VGIKLAPDRLIGSERPMDAGDPERQRDAVEEHHHCIIRAMKMKSVRSPIIATIAFLMKLLMGKSKLFAVELGFGRVVRLKVIGALAVALLPRLAPDHSTSNVWKTSAFADPQKRAISNLD
jgi:hypothetical protein